MLVTTECYLHAGENGGGVYINVTLIVSIQACDTLDFSTLSVIDALRTLPLKGMTAINDSSVIN